MTDVLWIFLFTQIALGGLDTLLHHEGTERLAWRPSQRRELRLHGVRNLLYAAVFLTLGWSRPQGLWAAALIAVLAAELIITLWDFVEEDRSRRLPASERVLHTVLTLNYGMFLTLLVPVLWNWAGEATRLVTMSHGIFSWLTLLSAAAVLLFGLRDLAAAQRTDDLAETPAAGLAASLHGRRRVLVTGGTGFVGRRLVEALVEAGHEVSILTREPAKAADLSAPIRILTDLDQIAGDTVIDAIVHLAGEPVSNGLWTATKRRRIIRSRARMARDICRLIQRLEQRPQVLVSGSAVGWYGLRGDTPLTERSGSRACFSHQSCAACEDAARKAEALGVRTVLLRTGLVLAADGGMLARMLTPFEFGLGGRFGRGHQWMSWIHRDDLVRMIVHAIETPQICGPLNGTAPNPVRNREFAAALGRALRRPALIPVPAPLLRLALGDMAKELLLGGQRVLPEKASRSGFDFRYPELHLALGRIVGRPEEASAPRPQRLQPSPRAAAV